MTILRIFCWIQVGQNWKYFSVGYFVLASWSSFYRSWSRYL